MQRYFSSFPDSWPGVSLLSLRILLASNALSDCTNVPVLPSALGTAISVAPALIGGGILIGLWTPVCAMVLAVFECYVALVGSWEIHGGRAVVAVCLAMLGPGAWSLDARLYGRKVIMTNTE
jgi:putative oxidoreductase